MSFQLIGKYCPVCGNDWFEEKKVLGGLLGKHLICADCRSKVKMSELELAVEVGKSKEEIAEEANITALENAGSGFTNPNGEYDPSMAKPEKKVNFFTQDANGNEYY